MPDTASLDRSRPWYREPWPWLLAIMPVATVIAGAVTLGLAIDSYDGLIAQDYYKQGLAINRELKRSESALLLGLSAEMHVDGERGEVLVRLSDSDLRPRELLLQLAHPTRAGQDRVVRMKAVGPGRYAGSVRLPDQARWNVVLEDAERRWRLAGAWNTSAQGARLAPAL